MKKEVHKGKIAIITGGANGIGFSISKTLIKEGALIAIIDNDFKNGIKSEKYLQSLGKVKFFHTDISKKINCKNVIEEVFNFFGSIDYLVNNAVPKKNKKNMQNCLLFDWKKHSEIVIEASLNLSVYASKYIKNSINPSIVNLSSIVSEKVANNSCSLSYHISKAGLNQLTRYLAKKIGYEYQIRVNAIAPGLIKKNDLLEHDHIVKRIVPLKRHGEKSEVGDLVSFLLSNKSSYITGQIITIDGGLGLSENYELSKTF